MGGEASAREGKPKRLVRARQNSPPLLRGVEASARELSLSLSLSSLSLSLLPSFAVEEIRPCVFTDL